jgi:hypothetical protein
MHAQNSNCERIHLNAKRGKDQLFGVKERLSGLLGYDSFYQDILQELENEGFNSFASVFSWSYSVLFHGHLVQLQKKKSASCCSGRTLTTFSE